MRVIKLGKFSLSIKYIKYLDSYKFINWQYYNCKGTYQTRYLWLRIGKVRITVRYGHYHD